MADVQVVVVAATISKVEVVALWLRSGVMFRRITAYHTVQIVREAKRCVMFHARGLELDEDSLSSFSNALLISSLLLKH